MGSTETVARFIVETKYDALPPKAVDTTKSAVLDYIGCTLAGGHTEEAEIICDYVKEVGSPKHGTTVIGKGFKISPSFAALANGTMGHALDYDDYTSEWWWGHPSVAILPGLLALAEKNKLSGKALIEAYLVGYEAGSKVGSGLQVNMSHFKQGWHATGTIGTIAAVAGAARLMNFDLRQSKMMLGMGASMASGLRQNFGTMTKPFHAGAAASKSIMATDLIMKGLTATEIVLEGPYGMRAYAKEFDVAKMGENLGAPWDIMKYGLFFKPYPCCAGNHIHLDAIFNLIKKYNIKPGDVESVKCITNEFPIPDELIYHQPKTVPQAKFSLEFNLAAALLDRKVGIDQFTEARINAPDAQEMIGKIRGVFPGEAKPELPNRVTIKLKDGREVYDDVAFAKGRPANPMTLADIEFKFRDCAGKSFSKEKMDKIVAMVKDLDKVSDISELMALLA